MDAKNVKITGALTKGSIYRNIWTLSWPMMIASILRTGFSIVDMLWVGRLGPNAIAVAALSGILMFLMIAISTLVGTGTTAMVARFVGAGNSKDLQIVIKQSIFLAIIISSLVGIIGVIFAKNILILLGAETEVVLLGTPYIKIIFIGTPFLLLGFVISSVFRGTGDTKTPMKIMVTATTVNIILDPLLIFGIGFFPKFGVSGAAIATTFARMVVFLMGTYILLKGHSAVHLSLKEGFNLNFSFMKRILSIGIPSTIGLISRNLSELALMRIVALYGTYAIAAYGIGMRVRLIAFMPCHAFSLAAAILVGQNLGAKKPERSEKSVITSALFATTIMGLLGVVFFIFPSQMISIFNTNPEIIKFGVSYLRIVAFAQMFVGVSMSLRGAFLGAGDTRPLMFLTIISLWMIQIPVAFFLSVYLKWGATGIWWGIAIASICEAIITTFWFRLGRWKLKKV